MPLAIQANLSNFEQINRNYWSKGGFYLEDASYGFIC